MTTWIYPGDAPVVTARRVAWAYRQRLGQVAPDDCEQLDDVVRKLGQHWAIPQTVPANPDAWVNAAKAAAIAGISIGAIGRLRRAGRLTGMQKSPRRWQYQVREILALATRPRTRQKREMPEPTKREG